MEPVEGTLGMSVAEGSFAEVSDYEGSVILDGCMGPCMLEIPAHEGAIITTHAGDEPGQVSLELVGQ